MNLAEELLLCSIGDDGYIASSHKIAAVVGGGLVAELSLAGRVRIEDDKLVPGDPAPVGDPLLDELITAIQDPNSSKLPASTMIAIFGKQAFPRVSAAVADAGAVQMEQGARSWIGVRKPETYRLTPVGEEPRTRARDALTGTQPVDPRTTTLAALVVASGYHKVIVPKDQRNAAEQRGQAFAAGDGVAPAVVDAIAAVRATAASLAA
jgi:hypothetical protein